MNCCTRNHAHQFISILPTLNPISTEPDQQNSKDASRQDEHIFKDAAIIELET